MIRLLTAVLLLLATLTYSCYEPVEGCLDIAAVNFNASADEDCCCEYPTLRIQLIQRFETLVDLSAKAYTNNLGQVFRLDNAVLYLHRFSFSQLGNTYPVTDSLALQVFDGPDRPLRADRMEVGSGSAYSGPGKRIPAGVPGARVGGRVRR